MKSKEKVFIRVDGNNQIGYGHVFRCLSLAEMISEICNPIFVIQNSSDFVISQIENSNYNIHEIPKFENLDLEVEFLNQYYFEEGCIVILDGYHYTSDYQKKLKTKEKFLICIDDLHHIHYFADVIINQAESVDKSLYITEQYTNICSGYKWVMQRKAFREAQFNQRSISNFTSVFFTLGGAFIKGIAPKIIEALSDYKTIYFLKGNDDLYKKEIEPIVKYNPKIKILEKLDAKELVNVFSNCDFAICPASVIALEACAVGVMLFTGITADNQIDNYKGLIDTGVSIGLGDLRECESDSIKKILIKYLHSSNAQVILQKQKEYFDGSSKARYINLIKNRTC